MEYVGIRPGEKLHEVLISEDEARNTLELDDMFVIQPSHSWWRRDNWKDARPLAEGFRYTSDANPDWMTKAELQELIDASSSTAGPRLVDLPPARATATA